MNAHPTAIIESGAEIADDAEIGPNAYISAESKIGAGCRISSQAHLVGKVELGARSSVGIGAIIGTDPQSVGFDPAIQSGVAIGENNVIREHATIHRSLYEGENTRVGNDNFLMTGSHLGHDTVIGDRNVIANNCLLGGHVIVGNRCFLGGGAVFHQFTRIGDLVIVQGQAALGLDLPPFVIAAGRNRVAGINVVGLRRADFDRETRAGIKEAFDLFYNRGLNLSQAQAEAEKREWQGHAADFVAFFQEKSHRGFCLQSGKGAR